MPLNKETKPNLNSIFSFIDIVGMCCEPVKGPEERHELRITLNKYIEWKYKYSIGKRVLNVNLTGKVLGWN